MTMNRTSEPAQTLEPAGDSLPASADLVKRLLADGCTVHQAAQQAAWPRDHILALVNGIPGWRYQPDTDTVYINPDPDPAPAPAPAPVPAAPAGSGGRSGRRSTAKPPRPPRTDATAPAVTAVDRMLTDAQQINDPAVRRTLERAWKALADLRDAVDHYKRRQAAEREVAELERRLAAARTRAKELAGRRPSRTPRTARPPQARPRDSEVRAWAKAHGIPVNDHGRVPGDLVRQYEAAHTAGS
ncbi:Lsr2 family DNA-binding protein [Thermomonospora cellulosilytica]|uniref:Lsr2 DNA-binding domain-containing protein n=1 Tax=Thermomonospora cellulosilytica TaxID=1411118 RepID=A0A7W3N1Z5_9ACTN|nr:histone-like nucleoid-structuring protein Lsr2 [Thermomonospora cellulosilytica]MBA9005992.1 hypothetical protein [Thermomonospora cellulosilytica]